MATFKEALEYAANNPTSDFAKAFGMEVATGRHDAEARQFGYDTTPIKQRYLPLLEKKMILDKRNKEMEIEKQRIKNAQDQSTLESFGVGVGKSALGLFKGLSQIGTKIGNFILPKNIGGVNFELPDLYSEEALAADSEKGGFRGRLLEDKNLETKNTAEGAGKLAGDVAQFFIPAGTANKAEKALTVGTSGVRKLLTKMGVRAVESGAVTAAQTGGDKKDTFTSAAIGGAMPLVGAAVGKGKEMLKNYRQNLMGALSGRGKAVIEEVSKNPKAAIEGLTGESVETLSKDAQLLKETAVGMKEEATREYNRVLNNLEEIYINEGKSFDKGAEINKITDMLQSKFGITKAGKIAELTGEAVDDAGALDFAVTRFQKPNEQNTIKNALNFIKSFRDPFTPKSIENMASTIDKMKGADSELNSVLHTITSSLRNSVAEMGEQAGYQEGADLARNFAKAMDKLDDFTQKFKASPEDFRPVVEKTGDKVGKVILTEQEKTKIAADLSTLFSGNKDLDKDTLRKIVFGGKDILAREAGRTLKTAPEKASTKLGEFIREAVISPILSPEKIGMMEAKLALGPKAGGKTGKLFQFIEALKVLEPAKRAAVIKLITDNND